MRYVEAINRALKEKMSEDESVICYGLGADDPKRIFGTTDGLAESFGKRVFDMPTSENAMLGIGVGAAINGLKPVMMHQRLDFFLLAMDQLVNSAAKWNYMFNGKQSIPLTIRLVVGKGWGQGPTHAQNLHAWFAHIPGLKVVMPTTPNGAYHLLKESISDPNPVVFIEHRWLHHQEGPIVESETEKIGEACLLAEGNDLTIVANSYLVVEARRVAEALAINDIHCDLIDLRTIKPIDWAAIDNSIEKTGRLLVLDNGHFTGSISADIVAHTAEENFKSLKAAPKRITLPDHPEPTSYGLTKAFYPSAYEIAMEAHKMVTGRKDESLYKELIVDGHHDVPGEWFSGPF